jgi:hypothetical protein
MKQLAFAGRPSPAAAIFFPVTEHDVAAKFGSGAPIAHTKAYLMPRAGRCVSNLFLLSFVPSSA